MEELTRRAVDTELGRGYRGMRLLRTRGESGLEVRKRIETWKERVERAQSITIYVREMSKAVLRSAYGRTHIGRRWAVERDGGNCCYSSRWLKRR